MRAAGPHRDRRLSALLLAWIGCAKPGSVVRYGPPGGGETGVTTRDTGALDSGAADTDVADTSACPADMAPTGAVCMDRYEAPNVAGVEPLVMYTYDEAESWCEARSRRLCTDAEWESACAGSNGSAYPYGDTREAGVCNDDKTWLVYDQSRLDEWPASASATDVSSLDDLLTRASASSAAGADAADELSSLYQGDGGGESPGCSSDGVIFDLVGNVEEWTRRADGGEASFHGNLKGRYWADTRTCQDNITTHGDAFRFYEIGFRCCQDP